MFFVYFLIDYNLQSVLFIFLLVIVSLWCIQLHVDSVSLWCIPMLHVDSVSLWCIPMLHVDSVSLWCIPMLHVDSVSLWCIQLHVDSVSLWCIPMLHVDSISLWCIPMLHVDSVSLWCIPMLHVDSVSLWCIPMLHVDSVSLWCIPMLHVDSVSLWCIPMLHVDSVSLWCIPMLHVDSVSLWCIPMLHVDSVSLWCIPMLHVDSVSLWCTVKPPIKDTSKEDKPPNKGHTICILVYTLDLYKITSERGHKGQMGGPNGVHYSEVPLYSASAKHMPRVPTHIIPWCCWWQIVDPLRRGQPRHCKDLSPTPGQCGACDAPLINIAIDLELVLMPRTTASYPQLLKLTKIKINGTWN